MFQEISFQKLIRAVLNTNKSDTASQTIVLRRSNIASFAHHAMLVSGVAAMTVLVLMFVKPELTDDFQAISPFFTAERTVDEPGPASADSVATDKTARQTTNPQTAQLQTHAKQQQQQKSVTKWLAKRYRIANDAANVFVTAAYHTAKEFKLDPLLILSVMAIESGLNPYAESPVGAQGLMQVMSKIHEDKFDDLGGLKAALDPVANIRVGAQILKEYVTRGGSVEAGLKMYVGAALAQNDGGYGSKVLAEYRRLKDVSNGKTVPPFSTNSRIAVAKPAVIKLNEKVSEKVNEKLSENDVKPELLAAT